MYNFYCYYTVPYEQVLEGKVSMVDNDNDDVYDEEFSFFVTRQD